MSIFFVPGNVQHSILNAQGSSKGGAAPSPSPPLEWGEKVTSHESGGVRMEFGRVSQEPRLHSGGMGKSPRTGTCPCHPISFTLYPRLVTRDFPPGYSPGAKKNRPARARVVRGRPGHFGRDPRWKVAVWLRTRTYTLRRRRSMSIPPTTIRPSVAGSGVTRNSLEIEL